MRRYLSFATAALSPILLFLIVYRVDSWVDNVQRMARREFQTPLSWLGPLYLANLPVAALLITVLWYFHFKAPAGRVLGAMYVIVGLAPLVYNVAVIAIASQRREGPSLLWSMTANSFSALVSGIIALTGVQRLILPRALSSPSLHDKPAGVA